MNQSLFHLLHLSDLTLPIGGFSHSSGLETYVQNGLVHDITSAQTFIEAMLSKSVFYNDAMYLSLAYDACLNNDWDRIIKLDQHCNATKLPNEIRTASKKLGLRLIKIFHGNIENEQVEKLKTLMDNNEINGHYSIVYAILACTLAIKKQESLVGFYYNTAMGFITNAVKLIPLGQDAGQKILFNTKDLINELARLSMVTNEKLLGLCSIGFDIRSMQHEDLYSRLYIS